MPSVSPILRAVATKGKPAWKGDDGMRFFRMLCALEGKEIEITLRKRQKKRTLSQNAYLHFLIGLLAEHVGYQPDEMKDALKWKFLQIHGDSAIPTVKSTASLDTTEMARFIDNIKQFGAELGCYLPDPGEILNAA